jgi:hypothetical protein
MIGTDAEQPKHGESEVVASHRRRGREKREKLVTGA